MSNTRFSTYNWAADPTTIISTRVNESLGYPTESAIDHDRYTYFRTNGIGETRVHVDFNAPRTIKLMGMRSLIPISGANTSPLTVESSTDNSAWTMRASVSVADPDLRDIFVENSVAVSARYWRFRIQPNGAHNGVGGIWLGGNYEIDFGVSFTRTEGTMNLNRTLDQTIGGQAVVQTMGLPHKTMLIVLDHASMAQKNLIEDLMREPRAVILMDAFDKAYEVVPLSDGYRYESIYLATGVASFRITLELRQLP